MANPSIRGHHGKLSFFENGKPLDVLFITKADVNQDSSFSRAFYVGEALGEGDQTIDGWSGSVDVEVKSGAVDDMIDALITNNLAGVGISDYSMVLTEEYGDGTVRSWAYFDMQFKMSRSQSGQNEKVTKKLDFQASGRVPL